MVRILLFTNSITNTLQYVIQFIESQYEDLKFVMTTDQKEYEASNLSKINYSTKRISDQEIFIRKSSQEKPSEIAELTLQQLIPGIKILFPTLDDDFGFDLFKSLFWMLSHSEDYSNSQRDQHNRFLASYSKIFTKEERKIPVCDVWIERFILLLNTKFNTSLKRNTSFSWSIGMDIDQPWKYKYKSLWKQCGGIIKNILIFNFSEVFRRLNCLIGNRKDPFDQYQYLDSFQFKKDQLIYFILSKTGDPIDSTHSINSKPYRILLRHLSSHYTIAWHPSYHSIENPFQFANEKKELEDVISQAINKSRQHYLRVWPLSQLQLISKLNIIEDYSMLFPDSAGFKGGTTHPYFLYDLEKNEPSSLTVIPVLAMDRTFLNQGNSYPNAIIHEINLLIEQCKKYKGHAHIIWHNSSFDFEGEWRGWNDVFNSIVESLRENNE